MEQSKCSLNLADDKKELEIRGTLMFPCEGYAGNVQKYITGEIPWHWHEEIEVFYLIQGQMKVRAGNQSFVLNEGDGIFINSNVLHMGRPTTSAPCCYCSFVFHESLISGSAESIVSQKYVKPLIACKETPAFLFLKDISWQREAAHCIKNAFHAYEKGEIGFEFLVREQLSHMWYLMIRHCEAVWTTSHKGENQEAVRIKSMMNYIQEHFDDPLSIEEIAATANISQRECLRCFKKSLGVPPIQYLLKFRIAKAASLLKNTEMPVTDICSQTGFDSPSYFTLIFKRFMGCTPTEYRKELP